MTNKLKAILMLLLAGLMAYGCSTIAPDTGVTGRTIDCGGETRMLVDCSKAYDQSAHTMRVDIAKINKYAAGAGIGAKKLMQLDTVTGDLMAHQRQLCIDYNNCIMSKEEYKNEMAFLRRAQLKVRHAAAQMSGGPPGDMTGGDPYGGGGDGSHPPASPSSFGQLLDGIISDLSRDSDSGY